MVCFGGLSCTLNRKGRASRDRKNRCRCKDDGVNVGAYWREIEGNWRRTLEQCLALDPHVEMLYVCAEMMRHQVEKRIAAGTHIKKWGSSEGWLGLRKDARVWFSVEPASSSIVRACQTDMTPIERRDQARKSRGNLPQVVSVKYGVTRSKGGRETTIQFELRKFQYCTRVSKWYDIKFKVNLSEELARTGKEWR